MDRGEVDFEELSIDADALAEVFRTYIARPVLALAEAFVVAFRPVMEKFAEKARELHAIVYQEYVAQGAIYGETDEGFARWLEELAEINRLEAEAQRLRQSHEDLAGFKRSIGGLKRSSKT
ncbi:MAG: hypothetical protein KC441_00905 [Anaerolineales bacterium]|nr:hypothetical protein [Anaerolineales bacterium]